MNTRRIYNWLLAIMFVLTGFTGIMLHVATERIGIDNDYLMWGNIHSWVALAFAVLIFIHALMHGGWYKALKFKAKNSASRNRRLSVLLQDLAYVLLLLTGIWLLIFKTGWDTFGRFHWVLGLIALFLSAWHIIKRYKML